MAENVNRIHRVDEVETQEAPPDSIDALREQIFQHQYRDQHRGLLDRATTGWMNSGDEKSLAELKALEERAKAGNVKAGEIAAAVKSDKEAVNFQNEVTTYGTGFVKAATLFMPGKGKVPWGVIASGTVHSIDQVKVAPDVSGSQMAMDATLGFTKGAALKYTMDKVGAGSWRTWEKGLVIGGAGGALETGLQRENWVKDGRFDSAGLTRLGQSTVFGAGAGAVTFHFGHKLFKGVSAQTGGALERSPLAANMGMGFSFGATGGFTGEAMHQIQTGKFDPVNLAVRTVLQGTTDMFAGGAGYKAGRLYSNETAGAQNGLRPGEGPTLMQDISTGLKGLKDRVLSKPDIDSNSQMAGGSRKRGGNNDEFDSRQGDKESRRARRERDRDREREEDESEGWGTVEPVESAGKKKGGEPTPELKTVEDPNQLIDPVSADNPVIKPAVKTEEATALDSVVPPVAAGKVEPIVTSVEAVKTAPVVEGGKVEKAAAEVKGTADRVVEPGEAALVARIEKVVADGQVKIPDNVSGLTLYKKLPDILKQANGGQPIPEAELAAIKKIWNRLPQVVAEAKAKVEAETSAQPEQTPVVEKSEPVVRPEPEPILGQEEIVSGNKQAATGREEVAGGKERDVVEGKAEVSEPPKTGDEFYRSLVEREAGKGTPLNVLEKALLTSLHESRVADLSETLTLEQRIAEVQKQIAAEKNGEVAKPNDGPTPPEGFQKGEAIWRNKDTDMPVEITEYLGERDGRHYVKTKNSEGGIPLDEIVYPKVAGESRVDMSVPKDTNRIPDIDVVKETGGLFGQGPTEGNRLVRRAVTDAYNASLGEGTMKAEALARLKQSAVDHPELKPALEMIAKEHPELLNVVNEAFDGIVAPPPRPEQLKLADITTRRADGELDALVQEGTNLAVAASKNEPGALEKLADFAKRSTDSSDPAQPVYDVQQGMVELAKARPELRQAIYEAYQDTLTHPELVFFGGKLAEGAARGDAEAARQLDVFKTQHAAPEVARGMLDYARAKTEVADTVYELYKDNLSLEDAAFFAAKFAGDATGGDAAAVARFKEIAAKNQQPELVEAMWLLADRRPDLRDTILDGFNLIEAPTTQDLKAINSASQLIEAQIAARDAQRAGTAAPEAVDANLFIADFRNALQSRVANGENAADVIASSKKNLDRLARAKGLENSDHLNALIVEAAVPSHTQGEYNAARVGQHILEAQIADAKAVAAGTERPQLPNGEDFMRSVFGEMLEAVQTGNQPLDVVARMRTRMDLLAKLQGAENANDMLPFLSELATPPHVSDAKPAKIEINFEAPEGSVDVPGRIAEFNQIAQSSKMPGEFVQPGDTQVQILNKWFEHQMEVRREMFDWLNKNPDLWPYAIEFGKQTRMSPIAGMIDGYPHLQTNFLSDFPGYRPDIVAPSETRAPETTQEARPEARPEEQQDFTPHRNNPTVLEAVDNMNSGDGARQLSGALDSQFLMNPKSQGVEQFNRWRQIMKVNADNLPPEYKALFKRSDIDSIPDQVLMDFLSANTAEAPQRKGGWSWDKDMPGERAKQLVQALDAFKTPDMSNPAKAGDPAVQQAAENATALGIKLAEALASNRPLLNDIMFKLAETSPYRTQYKQMLQLMLENSNGAAQIKGVMDSFNQIQAVRETYQPRVPRGQPRVEMTPEQTQEMMGQMQRIIQQARDYAMQTNPSNPDLLLQIVADLALGKGQRDETPRKPPFGGGPGGPRPQQNRNQ